MNSPPGSFWTVPGPRDLLAEAQRAASPWPGTGEMSRDDLLRLLRRADRSFAPVPGEGCRAVNRDGFQVKAC